MRRLFVLVAVLLVNLPLVHQAWIAHRIDDQGRDTRAEVIAAQELRGRYFVDYRLARRIDPEQQRYTARIDRDTFERAEESRSIAVRYIPGSPGSNRVEGAEGSPLVWVVAAMADVVLVAALVALWLRRRRRQRFVVRRVGDGYVVVGVGRHDDIGALAPGDWIERIIPGEAVTARLVLLAEADIVPGPPIGRLEQEPDEVETGACRVRGRVVDVRPTEVVLQLDDGTQVPVQFGPHRNRADQREYALARGTLHLAPPGLSNL